MKKYTVVFCETNSSLLSNAIAFFKEDNDIELISCSSVKEYNEKTKEVEINGLIIDYEFPGVREVIHSYQGKQMSIALTGRFNESTASDMLMLTKYVYYKPYSLSEIRTTLLKNMLQQILVVRLNGNKNIDEKLSNIFIRAGIPPHIRGYQFLREAVKMSVACPEMINSITKQLYPSVAQFYNTTPSKVERAIRHAIEVAWNRGKIENLNAIFGIKIYNKGDKPTNGELIALVADKIMFESV